MRKSEILDLILDSTIEEINPLEIEFLKVRTSADTKNSLNRRGKYYFKLEIQVTGEDASYVINSEIHFTPKVGDFFVPKVFKTDYENIPKSTNALTDYLLNVEQSNEVTNESRLHHDAMTAIRNQISQFLAENTIRSATKTAIVWESSQSGRFELHPKSIE